MATLKEDLEALAAFPLGVIVKAIEDTAQVFHLAIPVRSGFFSGDLSDDDLENVVGGGMSWWQALLVGLAVAAVAVCVVAVCIATAGAAAPAAIASGAAIGAAADAAGAGFFVLEGAAFIQYAGGVAVGSVAV